MIKVSEQRRLQAIVSWKDLVGILRNFAVEQLPSPLPENLDEIAVDVITDASGYPTIVISWEWKTET